MIRTSERTAHGETETETARGVSEEGTAAGTRESRTRSPAAAPWRRTENRRRPYVRRRSACCRAYCTVGSANQKGDGAARLRMELATSWKGEGKPRTFCWIGARMLARKPARLSPAIASGTCPLAGRCWKPPCLPACLPPRLPVRICGWRCASWPLGQPWFGSSTNFGPRPVGPEAVPTSPGGRFESADRLGRSEPGLLQRPGRPFGESAWAAGRAGSGQGVRSLGSTSLEDPNYLQPC
jgi:hypothetical protein